MRLPHLISEAAAATVYFSRSQNPKMNPPQSHNHHYVPQWYQKRFLPTGYDKLFYLNLKPQKVEDGERSYFRRNPQRAGVANCFCQDDLYAM